MRLVRPARRAASSDDLTRSTTGEWTSDVPGCFDSDTPTERAPSESNATPEYHWAARRPAPDCASVVMTTRRKLLATWTKQVSQVHSVTLARAAARAVANTGGPFKLSVCPSIPRWHRWPGQQREHSR